MLNSPTCDANGYSNLFSSSGSDFASLKSTGNNKAAATTANGWMVAADQFLAAYGSNIDPLVRNRLLSYFEVRAVMLVHGKKSDTRKNYASIEEIAREFHEDCKRADPKIPTWNKLPVPASSEPVAITATGKGLREIGAYGEGMVDDSLLLEKGFKNDQAIQNAKTGELYKIIALDANKKTVTCILMENTKEATASKAANAKKIQINRADLLQGVWTPYKEIKQKFCTDIRNPLDNFDYKASAIAGIVKNAIALEFTKSSEDDCVLQTAPDNKVICTKAVKKIGSFKLVGISNSISVQPIAKDVGPIWKVIGWGDDFKVVIRPCSNSIPNSGPGATRSRLEPWAPKPFIAKFWSVRETFDQAVVNCEFKPKAIEVVYFGKKLSIDVPVIVNTASISDEGDVIVLKADWQTKEPLSAAPPAQKKRKSR